MVFKYLTFAVDDNFLNTRPGSPPAFAPSPEASPRACIGCIGVISRFEELLLGDGSRDAGPVEEMQGENPGGSNGSAGIVDRIASVKVKVVMKVRMNDHTWRFYFFALPDRCSKVLRLAGGFPGVQSVALRGGRDQIEVTGEIDVVNLTTLLRKKVGFAEIVSVAKAKKEDESRDRDKKDALHAVWPYPRQEIVYVRPDSWCWPL